MVVTWWTVAFWPSATYGWVVKMSYNEVHWEGCFYPPCHNKESLLPKYANFKTQSFGLNLINVQL